MGTNELSGPVVFDPTDSKEAPENTTPLNSKPRPKVPTVETRLSDIRPTTLLLFEF